MRYSLLAGGKRIRPVLAMATATAIGERAVLGPRRSRARSSSSTRTRSSTTTSRRWTTTTCAAGGRRATSSSARTSRSSPATRSTPRRFRHLLTAQPGEPARILAAARELAAATGVDGMVGGQYLDVTGTPDTPEQLRTLHALKTGRLIGASVICVLLLHGVDGGPEVAYRRFAAELGVLFQIVDDILDVTGTDDALGKPQGSDERHGKRTYVTHYGLDGARRLARECHAAARSSLRDAAPNGAPELEQITDFILTRTA